MFKLYTNWIKHLHPFFRDFIDREFTSSSHLDLTRADWQTQLVTSPIWKFFSSQSSRRYNPVSDSGIQSICDPQNVFHLIAFGHIQFPFVKGNDGCFHTYLKQSAPMIRITRILTADLPIHFRRKYIQRATFPICTSNHCNSCRQTLPPHPFPHPGCVQNTMYFNSINIVSNPMMESSLQNDVPVVVQFNVPSRTVFVDLFMNVRVEKILYFNDSFPNINYTPNLVHMFQFLVPKITSSLDGTSPIDVQIIINKEPLCNPKKLSTVLSPQSPHLSEVPLATP